MLVKYAKVFILICFVLVVIALLGRKRRRPSGGESIGIDASGAFGNDNQHHHHHGSHDAGHHGASDGGHGGGDGGH
jgi:hypothetical protein